MKTVEPVLFSAEPAWYKDRAIDILCIVLQVNISDDLPNVTYEIETVEAMAAALKIVYQQGDAIRLLSNPQEADSNKEKLLKGYYIHEENEKVKYIWDDTVPPVEFPFTDEFKIDNPFDFSTSITYTAHNKKHRMEDALSGEVSKDKTPLLAPIADDMKVRYRVLDGQFKPKPEDGTPVKKKAKTGATSAQSQSSPEDQANASSGSGHWQRIGSTLGAKALERLQRKVPANGNSTKDNSTKDNSTKNGPTIDPLD